MRKARRVEKGKVYISMTHVLSPCEALSTDLRTAQLSRLDRVRDSVAVRAQVACVNDSFRISERADHVRDIEATALRRESELA
jgi:hypothetical protein